MKQIFVILLFAFSLSSFAQVSKFEKTKFAIGESIRFQSKILNEERVLNIYLPYGYSPDSTKTYPVIYLLDGSIDEDFIHVSGLIQFLSFSWINGMPECIVVGISNVDRKRDFTWPTKNEQDKKDFPTTGGSANFILFLANEVQPLIKETYKVKDDQTIVGQSLGGLLAAEILVKFPHLFNKYVIVSPSIWWDNESLLSWEPTCFADQKSIFMAVGNEGKQMTGGAKKLFSKIKSWKMKNDLYFQYYPQNNHGDILHKAAYDGFLKIFKPKD